MNIYIYISMVYVYTLINANTSNRIYNVYIIVYLYMYISYIYILTLTAYRGTQCTVFTSLERFGIVISTTKEVCFPILTCFTKGGWQGDMFSVTPLMAKHLNAHLTQWKNIVDDSDISLLWPWQTSLSKPSKNSMLTNNLPIEPFCDLNTFRTLSFTWHA